MKKIIVQFTEIVMELKLLRKKVFTLKELAIHLRTSTRKISQLENGKCFDFIFLQKYCEILGFDLFLQKEKKLN